jgi:hypothetical protein
LTKEGFVGSARGHARFKILKGLRSEEATRQKRDDVKDVGVEIKFGDNFELKAL